MSRHTASPWTIARVLVFAGVVALGLRFALAWTLDGILYLIWFVNALPQAAVWFAVLTMVLVATLRLAPRAKRRRSALAPVPVTPRSDLLGLADGIRQAEVSPHARWVLRQRLGPAAASLRIRREPILFGQAWNDIEDGRWPAHPDVRAVLRTERGRTRLLRRRGFAQELDRAVTALERYARGGSLDGS